MTTIKTIGRSGQISLGKQYAGQHVLVEELEPGVWIVKLGAFVPDSEQWLLVPQVSASLDEAVTWAEQHPPQESDLDALEHRLKG